MFRVYQEDLRDCREDKISFSDTLLVQFSTGATQVSRHSACEAVYTYSHVGDECLSIVQKLSLLRR